MEDIRKEEYVIDVLGDNFDERQVYIKKIELMCVGEYQGIKITFVKDGNVIEKLHSPSSVLSGISDYEKNTIFIDAKTGLRSTF